MIDLAILAKLAKWCKFEYGGVNQSTLKQIDRACLTPYDILMAAVLSKPIPRNRHLPAGW